MTMLLAKILCLITATCQPHYSVCGGGSGLKCCAPWTCKHVSAPPPDVGNWVCL